MFQDYYTINHDSDIDSEEEREMDCLLFHDVKKAQESSEIGTEEYAENTFELANMYLHGIGTNQDPTEAYRLFQSLAIHGDECSMEKCAQLVQHELNLSDHERKLLSGKWYFDLLQSDPTYPENNNWSKDDYKNVLSCVMYFKTNS